MIVANGRMVGDDRGLTGGAAITGDGARWVDFSGPVGGGNIVGIAVVPHVQNGRTPFWFVADWGVVTVGPFRAKALFLEQGQSFASTCTIIAHGDAGEAGVSQIAKDIFKG